MTPRQRIGARNATKEDEMASQGSWERLPYEEWASTKKTLHMCMQMLGKARLALAPPQPQWLHTCLYLTGHGFTTGPMPYRSMIVSMGIDVFETVLWINLSDGRRASVPLGSARCVADIWADFRGALNELGLELDIWEKPQETTDVTHFSENRHDCTMDPAQVQRFHRVLSAVYGAFEEFRSTFFGRSGVQFWWGAFDLAVLLYTGKPLTPPEDRGYIMRYDLDAEHLNAGFWPGDDNSPNPVIYGYLVPQPAGCDIVPIEPEHGDWVEAMGEWMLPYDKVWTCEDPKRAILDFLNSVYDVALTNGEWNAEAHRCALPDPPLRS